MSALALTAHDFRRDGHRIAKIGTPLECGIYPKVSHHAKCLDDLARSDSKHVLYYQEACRYWVKAMVGLPFFKRNGKRMDPPHGRTVCFDSEEAVCYAACLSNSSLFYWFYSAFADCEHINDALLRGFPIPGDWGRVAWKILYKKLADDLARNATRKVIQTKQGHTIEYDEMKALLSKSVIDAIDAELGGLYGLTPNETDFIVNYDVKYRMGTADDEE